MGHLPYVLGHMNITEGQAELEVKSVVCLGALDEAEDPLQAKPGFQEGGSG